MVLSFILRLCLVHNVNYLQMGTDMFLFILTLPARTLLAYPNTKIPPKSAVAVVEIVMPLHHGISFIFSTVYSHTHVLLAATVLRLAGCSEKSLQYISREDARLLTVQAFCR
jgi:hypothetical protein